jgi:endo-1,4-beta-xylanase
VNNTKVTDLASWNQRREEIKELFMENEYGHRPAAPTIEIVSTTDWKVDAKKGVKTQSINVKMTNGEKSITTIVYVEIPTTATAENPAPVMMTHEDLYDLSAYGWGIIDVTDRSTYTKAGWCGAGIEYTEFATAQRGHGAHGQALPMLYGTDIDTGALKAWAWAFSRVVDVLEMVDYPEIDLTKIALTGHSRYGKCALLAGAFDERNTLSAPSHSGSAGSSLYKVYFPGTEALNANGCGAGYWL